MRTLGEGGRPVSAITGKTQVSLSLAIRLGKWIAGAYAAIALLQLQVRQHDQALRTLEDHAAKNTELLSDIKTRVAVIQSDITYLKSPVVRTSQEVHGIRKEMHQISVPMRMHIEACDRYLSGPFSMIESGR